MIERRITFYCGPDGLPAYLAKRLKQLAGYFSSHVALFNLAQLKKADLGHPLALLSLACKPGDLCQILIEGLDAELAHMVLTDFICEHFNPVVRLRPRDPAPAPVPTAPPWLLFPADNVQLLAQAHTKGEALAELVSMLDAAGTISDPSRLLRDIEQRETVSATVMARGIALPHVMSAAVLQPAIAITVLPGDTDWGSVLGPVTRAMLIALPQSPTRPEILGVSRLTRTLLNEDYCDALCKATLPPVIHAIVLVGIGRDSDSGMPETSTP